MSDRFSFILAGGGAAGLGLATALLDAGFRDATIAIVDPVEKKQNDRTWCYWSTVEEPHDAVATRRWTHAWFHGAQRSHRFDLAPFTYRMVRGEDFYRHALEQLESASNVTFVRERVRAIADSGDAARVELESGRTITGEWVFNSVFTARDFRVDAARYHYLKQHFTGWVVRADEAVFDPDAITLFDFRVPQRDAFRFMYLLPTDERTSLVEYTLFSERLLPPEEYEAELRAYLDDHVGAYEIVEREDGIIPMTDQPFPRREGRRVINTGTRGGRVKASTGFAFHRIQRDSRAIAANLAAGRDPLHGLRQSRGFAMMDSMLLSVLARLAGEGHQVFTDLFERNPTERLLRFLNEETSLLETIAIMNSVPWGPFIAAWFRIHARRALASLTGRRRILDAAGNPA